MAHPLRIPQVLGEKHIPSRGVIELSELEVALEPRDHPSCTFPDGEIEAREIEQHA